MNVDGKPFRTIWLGDDGRTVEIIDQTRLPHEFIIVEMKNLSDACTAIRDMWVRGAPLIGATAAYGVALAMVGDASDDGLANAYDRLYETRPTAVNLRWALDDLKALLAPMKPNDRVEAAYKRAAEIADEDVVITLSHEGFVKRIPMHLYRRRVGAGKALAGMERYEDDYLEQLFVLGEEELETVGVPFGFLVEGVQFAVVRVEAEGLPHPHGAVRRSSRRLLPPTPAHRSPLRRGRPVLAQRRRGHRPARVASCERLAP